MLSAAWLSFQETTGMKEAAAPLPPPPQSVADIVRVSDSSSSPIPLVRLVRSVGRHVKRRTGTYAALVAVALAAGVGLKFVVDIAEAHRRRCRRGRGTLKGPEGVTDAATEVQRGTSGAGEDEASDDFDFIDPALSRFTAAMRRIKENKEAPFFQVLAELQDLAHTRDALQRHAAVSGGFAEDEQQRCDDLTQRIAFKAQQADELLTQFVVSLDELPVGNRSELKTKRKAAVTEAVALAERFAPYLPSHQSAAGNAQREPHGELGPPESAGPETATEVGQTRATEQEGDWEDWDRISRDGEAPVEEDEAVR